MYGIILSETRKGEKNDAFDSYIYPFSNVKEPKKKKRKEKEREKNPQTKQIPFISVKHTGHNTAIY